jgi:sugar phosphate isomerase/epimerase
LAIVGRKILSLAMKIFFLTLLLGSSLLSSLAQRSNIPQIGIAQNIENDSLLSASGYTCLVESIGKLISPRSVTEEQFLVNLAKIKNLQTPMFAFNIFMPGDMKLVGPAVDEAAILKYVEVVFQRSKKAGVEMIIWGSGGARRIPDGFDPIKAKEQFIQIAGKVSALAKKYKIMLALENLNSTETNFINTVKEALEVVKAVDHPNFRLCADIYHMLMDNELPAVLEITEKYLVHVDIAERNGRTAPGVNGQDFSEYLLPLARMGYKGKIILECRFENLAAQAKPSYAILQKQLGEAYSKK